MKNRNHSPRPQNPGGQGPKDGRYWLYGAHSAAQALANTNRKVFRIVTTRNAADRLSPHVDSKRHPAPETLDQPALEKLLPPDATHQGVALQVAPLTAYTIEDVVNDSVASPRPVVLLDQVTDPHNIGAILRSAAAFDAGAVIVTRAHAPSETAVMAKAASGALDIVPLVHVGNLVQAMEVLKKSGFWCVGMDGEAKMTISDAKLEQKTAFVLGAEGKGLRRLTTEHCDMQVRLPMSDRMESLNVSVAAAVGLYELYRLR